MTKAISFDDVLIVPKFSEIKSRAEVDMSFLFLGDKYDLPVISSNMDTVTEYQMARAMDSNGAMACLHRFMSIEDNVIQFQESPYNVFVSVGVGAEELKRAITLYESGARKFVIDVAHGAAQHVVEQYDELRTNFPDAQIVVGNFATKESILAFNERVQSGSLPDAYKVGVGGGSLCTTRVVTGCGLPTLHSVIDCRKIPNITLIADGGIKNSGDIAKALAAGADAVMLGSMLSGTTEAPGDNIVMNHNTYKTYRGSASLESYHVQGKSAQHRTPEGESTLVPVKGSVDRILQQIEGGLRSAFSYVGARNINEFRENSQLIEVTTSSAIESTAHGKKN